MDLTGKIMLAFLEEDNPRRGLFHIRPLLTEAGPVPQSDIDALTDEGFIRIVPDKNEQYTFKDRMRTLGALCLINLRDFPADAGKLRANRNYAPPKGETHQYILYSDAVQALPPDLVFEVVAGRPEAPAPACLTPCCYLREGGRIEGPFFREDGSQRGAPCALRPDSAQLFSVALPGGQERLFYWPLSQEAAPAEPAAAPAPVAPAAPDAPADAGGETSARDLILRMEEELPQLENTIREETAFPLHEAPKEAPKMTGTPIYHVTAKRAPVKRAHNELHAVVGRYAKDFQLEAPGATMDDVSKLTQVESPVDVFKKALSVLWDTEDGREQAVSYTLGKPSAGQVFMRSMAMGQDCTVYAAMNRQLEDLEAERLSLLMQLDRARGDKEKLMKEALDSADRKAKEGLESLKKEQEALRAAVDTLSEQQHGLLSERERLVGELEKLGETRPVLAPAQGEKTTLDELADRVLKHLKALGIPAVRDEAIHAVLLCALYPAVQAAGGAASDSMVLARLLCRALGAQYAVNIPQAALPYLAGSDALAVSVQEEGSAEQRPYLQMAVGEGLTPAGGAYRLSPWPVLAVSLRDGKAGRELPAEKPFSLPALKAELASLAAESLSDEALKLVSDVDSALKKQGKPLPFALRHATVTYLLTAANVLDGGIASALDFAATSFLVPYMRSVGAEVGCMKPYLCCLPRTAQWL